MTLAVLPRTQATSETMILAKGIRRGAAMTDLRKRIILVMTGIALASPLLAQSGGVAGQASSDVVQMMFDCRTIEDSNERLACYDREVERVFQARESKDLVIADREQMKETRKGLFGFTLPKIGIFGGDKEGEDDVSQIDSTLINFGRNSGGKATFTIEGGARWVQIDNIPVLGNPAAGDSVSIEKAALGSYKAKIGKRRAIRVKRVD
ncbi:MAG: hypothetical protein EP350_03725 [Alphaproteobacteria bacterium]|nr:MAG: hypothetical protein EP350_03725 [Alphaproteobacteria bacterium]